MTRTYIFSFCALLMAVWMISPQPGWAQISEIRPAAATLPSPPQPQSNTAPVRAPATVDAQVVLLPHAAGAQAASYPDQKPGQAVQPPSGTMRLTRTQAEQLALKNNPRISVGRLLALAQHQVYRETRSAELPNFNGSVTAVEDNEGSR